MSRSEILNEKDRIQAKLLGESASTLKATVKYRGMVFLGLAERAAYVREGNTNLFKWNVLGLKHIVLSYIYPLRLSGWSLGFALPPDLASREFKCALTDESGKVVGSFSIYGQSASPNDPEAVLQKEGPFLWMPQQGWATAFLPLGETVFVIEKPGIHYLRDVTDGRDEIIGQLKFAVIDPLPLTEERIAAIKSDPAAMQAVMVELGCQHCPSKCRAYAALERSEKSESDGWVWYRNIPDLFTCQCGKTTLSLDTIRRNLFGFFGLRAAGEATNVSFIPLYERSLLATLRSKFSHLLTSKPKEELLQQFLARLYRVRNFSSALPSSLLLANPLR